MNDTIVSILHSWIVARLWNFLRLQGLWTICLTEEEQLKYCKYGT